MSRRQEILDTAADLFLERGYHGVGIDAIGKAVGVSGPAIYHHFSGKDEILAELFAGAMDRVSVDTSGEPTPRAELELLVRHHAEFVVRERALVAIWAHEHRSLVNPWRRKFDRRAKGHADHWGRVIAACWPDADEADVAIAVQAAVGTLNSVCLWPERYVAAEGTVDRLVAHVHAGLTALDRP